MKRIYQAKRVSGHVNVSKRYQFNQTRECDNAPGRVSSHVPYKIKVMKKNKNSTPSKPFQCLIELIPLTHIYMTTHTFLVRTKLKGERMECNIGKDAIFLTHSELLYFLGIFIKED
jgi:hypothetical protein